MYIYPSKLQGGKPPLYNIESILSVRINNYCDILNIFVEEQNGCRQNRSCIDHIFSITTIVKNYICEYKHVFCAFIDFKKAFDIINRDLLFYRLVSYNIDGKIFKAIKGLYRYGIHSKDK